MDNNITFYTDDIFFCIFCKCIFRYDNYYNHLKTKKHLVNKKNKNKIKKENEKYVINFN
jgi:uncharacterized C2H2 Zn-finger protein